MKQPLIQFINVKKSFGSNHVMQGVNLSIFEGEITAVIGKSGCGKSVLLKHIIGLMTQDSGEILIFGKNLSSMNKKKKRIFKKKLSYMFQENALFDFLNVFDNIALPLSEKSSLGKQEIREKVMIRMKQLEIETTGDKYHIRSLENLSNLIFRLSGSLSTHLGEGSCSESAGYPLT